MGQLLWWLQANEFASKEAHPNASSGPLRDRQRWRQHFLKRWMARQSLLCSRDQSAKERVMSPGVTLGERGLVNQGYIMLFHAQESRKTDSYFVFSAARPT